jgi:hypothetical protein
MVGLGSAAAQARPIELGLDGAVAVKVDEPRVFTVSLPIQTFRVGFFVSEQVAVEPRVAWNLVKVQDLDAVSTLSGEVGLLYHFAASPERSRAFVRPFAGIDLIGAAGETASQVTVGGALG